MSAPGERCLYLMDLESQFGVENDTITDISIQNLKKGDKEFGPIDTFVSGVNQIAPVAE